MKKGVIVVKGPDGGGSGNKSDDSSRKILIEVATKLFAEKGFDSTSTREIAQNAQLNISLISYYFEGKEGLYKAVISEFAEAMKKESEKMFASFDFEKMNRDLFMDFMKRFISRMLPMKYSNKDINMLFHREVLAGLPYAKDVFENTFSVIVENLVKVLEKAQDKKIIRKDINPYIFFFSLVHSVDQFILLSDRCKTPFQAKVCQLPLEMELYSEQVYKIFIEGVML